MRSSHKPSSSDRYIQVLQFKHQPLDIHRFRLWTQYQGFGATHIKATHIGKCQVSCTSTPKSKWIQSIGWEFGFPRLLKGSQNEPFETTSLVTNRPETNRLGPAIQLIKLCPWVVFTWMPCWRSTPRRESKWWRPQVVHIVSTLGSFGANTQTLGNSADAI